MAQDKKHKTCIQDVINKTKTTHSCYKEYPISRNGNFHFIDTVGFPHPDKTHLKPFATECEDGSSSPQRESNKLDLLEFKKHYPDSEIFQIESADELDTKKLVKQQQKSQSLPQSKPKFQFKRPMLRKF